MMRTVTVAGVRFAGICSCVPAKSEDSLARCAALYGDGEKARSVVEATGIRSRRVLEPGVTALDLCVRAAETVLAKSGTAAADIGAAVCVTFTPDRLMPSNACVAAARLGLAKDIPAFDLNLACSGWLSGVYVAGLMAKSLGRKVLLLDGDTQTAHLDPNDAATVPLLSDAGTAAILEPVAEGAAEPFLFAFLTEGGKGDALQLPVGGTISMDGFGVFKFATTDVLRFVESFLSETKLKPEEIDAFVPHQANVYMIRQIAKKLGLAEKLKVSGDVLGNSASATVPTTIAWAGAHGRVLAVGFGGGLAASVARLTVDGTCPLAVLDYRR